MTRHSPTNLQVRQGRFSPVGVTVAVSGVDGNVSSSTVTTFELDGQVTRFSGHVLPCQAGDEAIVAGYLNNDGVFVALAVRLPRQGVLLGGSSWVDWMLGVVFCAVGLAVLVGFAPIWVFGEWDHDPLFGLGATLFTAAFGAVFVWMGRQFMRNSNRARSARDLLEDPLLHTARSITA